MKQIPFLILILLVHNMTAAQNRLKPLKKIHLSHKISEGSGIVCWNGRLWTHNDSGSARIFEIDSANGNIINEYNFPGKAIDWEEMAQDSANFYIGDFGNNFGIRDTLTILRINKRSLLNNQIVIDTISFSWPEVYNFGKTEKINFDCEAMVVTDDSIYLFTKEFKRRRITRLFSISKIPGIYVAGYKSELKTRVLITGASFNPKKNQLKLCGYNLWLRPFVLSLANVKNNNFLSGKFRKQKIRLHMKQTEGIDSFDGENFFLINEYFSFWFLRSRQAIHKIKI